MNLKSFRIWKGEVLPLGLILGLSLVGASPLWAQTAGFAYVTNASDSTISAYTINATTGALTPVPGSPFAAGWGPISVTTTAPARSCEHDDEERDRDERGDGDEHSEGHKLSDDGHKGHKKHGCHHSREKDFEEHDDDKMHESERGRF